ncbi:hypothetical protein mRhiFer1_008622 [Rhinolophus ferrumequinum]|uniref:Mucin-16-like n=1 Tax=Rhinolophus ferrumequinum TaxID=59479 RepID=A0A7J7U0T4_RHIFE|nr:hypothetical protein mRhiFer1_008622 [Rhinolophus ferrumequinum]
METKDVSHSSGSQSEMSVPREASTSGSWASTATRYPHVPSSARLSLSHAIQELRTTDRSPRTEATSAATHPEGLETLKIPYPASPATIAWTSTDAVEHSTRSPDTSPASETQSAPAPGSVDVSTSSTTGSSTSEPTSDAPGESLALTTTAHNTITSWLWALTTSPTTETRLNTSSTEEIVPDVSSPSSSKTFATFPRVSIPPHKLSKPGVDTSALQNTDSTTLVQHREEFRFSGTAEDLTPLPATASQDLTVSPKPSASISLIYSSLDTTTIGVTTKRSTDVPESSFPGLSSTEARKSSSPLPPLTPPSTETTSPAVLTTLVLNPHASRKGSTPSQPVSSMSPGLKESVATTSMELSEGPHGGTTGSVGDVSSLVTAVSLGLPTGSPGTSENIRNPSLQQQPSGSHETGTPVQTSLREPLTQTAPVETTVGPATRLSMVTGSGSIRLAHLPTGTMVPAESSTEMVVATDRMPHSPYPAEAWVSPGSGTLEGTRQLRGTVSSPLSESTPPGLTGNVQHVSPVLTPQTTEMDLSAWLGSTGGTTVDTHVPSSTSSTGLPGSAGGLVTIPTGTTSSVTDTSELRSMTWVSTAVIPSTALSKTTVTAERQTRGPVGKSYSSASPWSERTSGRDLTLSASSATADTAVTTPRTPITPTGPWTSDESDGSATMSLISVTRGKTGSSPLGGPKSEALSRAEATDTTSPPRALSVTSSLGGPTSKERALTLEAVTSSPRGTRAAIMPSPERRVWTTGGTQTVGTSSWTVTDTAAHFPVTGLPRVPSTARTLSSSALATATGSPHRSSASTGTSLATLPSSYSGGITEASPRLDTFSPGDTTLSAPIATFSDDQGLSTSFRKISDTNLTPQSPETTVLPISFISSEKSSTQTDVHSSPPTLMHDVSTVTSATRRSVSSASVTDSIHVGATRSQELTLGPSDSSSILLLPSPTGAMTGGAALRQTAGHTEVSVTGKLLLTSREPERSSVLSPTMNSTSRQKSTVSVTLPRETTSTVGTVTLNSSAQGQSVKAPRSEMTDSPISRGEVQTTAATQLTPEMTSISPISLGTISELTQFPGPLTTTDLMATNMESGTTTPPLLMNSSHDRLATSKTTTDTETNASADAAVTTHCDTCFGSGPPSSAPAYSESHKTFSPMVAASTVDTTSVSPSLSTYPVSWEDPASTQTSGLRETSNSKDSSSVTDGNTVSSRVSSASTTEVTRTEFTSDRISGSSPTPSLGTPDISKGTNTNSFTSSPMTESSHLTLTTPTGPSRATPEGALTLNKTTPASQEGTTVALIQSFPLSEMTIPVRRGPETLSGRSPSLEAETGYLSSPLFSPSSISPSSSFSEAREPRVVPSPPASGLIPSTSSTNIQSQKTTALAGTGSPEDLSWSLSSAAGEDGTPDTTSANVTTLVGRSEPPKATTSGIAESPATKESFPDMQPRSAPVPDESTPFTSKDHLFLNSFALLVLSFGGHD